ncbi:MAG: tRNA (guanosine(37)-N1)-methyltransferase TrmD [Gammaproteobacteria bacterium]|nr:tRNA (guanosine(37)-N1)-methyltransferase TrmD [Gammaproteobacteria bacterium]
MRIDVVTLFPQLLTGFVQYGIPARALERGLYTLGLWNPRDFTHDRHRTVDDRPYGGGPGMLMKIQPLRDAINAARQAGDDKAHVVYLSPQGRRLDQHGVEQLAGHRHLVLIAGRYEGVDERLVEAEVDEEWSIGDYVLSGGEVAAMAMMDALIRLLPGALGHDDSAQQDSFSEGLLDYPHYTRPDVFEGREVPGVLLSGDHAAIERWRHKQALGRTWLRRPDLLEQMVLDERQQKLLQEFIHEYEQN